MQTGTTPIIKLCLAEGYLSAFYSLLQLGVRVKAQVGKSVSATFIEEFGLDSNHINQIQTIFLDGKTVDDLDASVVRDGSVLALSSAMPGLVGATLRRGSYYAAMRSQITAAETQDTLAPQQGMITLKLFNLVLRDLASIFLKRGIWIEKRALHDFLVAQPVDLWKNCREAHFGERMIAPESVPDISWPTDTDFICLRVETGDSGSPAC